MLTQIQRVIKSHLGGSIENVGLNVEAETDDPITLTKTQISRNTLGMELSVLKRLVFISKADESWFTQRLLLGLAFLKR